MAKNRAEKTERLPVLYDNNGIRLTPDETRAILWFRAQKRLGRGPEALQMIQSIADNAKRLQKGE